MISIILTVFIGFASTSDIGRRLLFIESETSVPPTSVPASLPPTSVPASLPPTTAECGLTGIIIGECYRIGELRSEEFSCMEHSLITTTYTQSMDCTANEEIIGGGIISSVDSTVHHPCCTDISDTIPPSSVPASLPPTSVPAILPPTSVPASLPPTSIPALPEPIQIAENYPYIAAVLYDTNNDGNFDHVCDGSLIRKTYPGIVLTAASCIWGKPNTFKVKLYASNMGEKDIETNWFVQSTVKNVYINPEYADEYSTHWSTWHQNDAALIYLQKDISTKDRIKSIELPLPSDNMLHDNPELIGYGYYDELNDDDRALRAVGWTDSEYTNFCYAQGFLCFEAEDTFPYNLGIGGPLVVMSDSTPYQIGLRYNVDDSVEFEGVENIPVRAAFNEINFSFIADGMSLSEFDIEDLPIYSWQCNLNIGECYPNENGGTSTMYSCLGDNLATAVYHQTLDCTISDLPPPPGTGDDGVTSSTIDSPHPCCIG